MLQRFLQNSAGGVAPMFAIAAIPLIGAMGAAIDYGRAASARTQLLAAADAASLASVRKGSAAMTAAASMNGDGPIADGATEATKLFNAEIIGAKAIRSTASPRTSRRPVRTSHRPSSSAHKCR